MEQTDSISFEDLTPQHLLAAIRWFELCMVPALRLDRDSKRQLLGAASMEEFDDWRRQAATFEVDWPPELLYRYGLLGHIWVSILRVLPDDEDIAENFLLKNISMLPWQGRSTKELLLDNVRLADLETLARQLRALSS